MIWLYDTINIAIIYICICKCINNIIQKWQQWSKLLELNQPAWKEGKWCVQAWEDLRNERIACHAVSTSVFHGADLCWSHPTPGVLDNPCRTFKKMHLFHRVSLEECRDKTLVGIQMLCYSQHWLIGPVALTNSMNPHTKQQRVSVGQELVLSMRESSWRAAGKHSNWATTAVWNICSRLLIASTMK